jgi:hypothetical protein
MSSKLPVISGEDLIRALEKFGYVRVRQRAATCVCGIRQTRSASLLRFRFMMKLRLVPSSGFFVMQKFQLRN